MNESLAKSRDPLPSNPLPSALGSVTYSIDQLDQAVSELRNRLNPVLTPSMPSAETKGGDRLTAAAPPVSEMTDLVTGHSRRIDGLTMLINDVTCRLEV